MSLEDNTKNLNAREFFHRVLRTMSSVSSELPKMRYHLSNHVVNFHDNFVMATVRFDGIPYESIADKTLENELDALNRTYAEAAREKMGRLAFYTHQCRQKTRFDHEYIFANKFCQDFANKYLQRFNQNDYYENNFYITIVLKFTESIDEAVEELESVLQSFVMKLNRYEPYILSCYRNAQGVLCSEVFEFYYRILNAEPHLGGYPLTGSPAYMTLPSSSIHAGYEVLEIRGAIKKRYAAVADLKDFPRSTKVGMFDKASLTLPFEYNLIQSLTAVIPSKALHRAADQINRMRSTNDKADHEKAELEEAQGHIQSGELVFGDYHCSIVVYGSSPAMALQNLNYAMASFSNNAGAIFRKATLSAPASYYSQFPLYKSKPRKMFKSSINLAATFGMHNYSRGKEKGNPLGDGSAVMPLETLSKTLYWFNHHFTNPLLDTTGEKIAGHTLIIGETGAGKTTIQSAMMTFLQRFNPALFALDKDNSMEILIRAFDGDYFNIKKGEPTGINPFQFEDTPRLRDFLNDLVVSCASDAGQECTSEEQNQIKQAIDSVMAMPFEARRFRMLLQGIPNLGGNSLYQRLLKWCYDDDNGIHGRHAWALDNATNQFDARDFKIVGFEVGEILVKDYQPTEPLLACLLYMKNIMIEKHSLITTVIEECWLPLMYDTTREMIKDSLKTGRKKDEIVLLVTQSPEELITNPDFPTIVQQTPTKVLLANTEAEYENEQGGGYKRIGLTVKEFVELSKLTKDSRAFLIKQGHQSSFGVLNLYGFKDEIAVLSSNKENIHLVNQIIERLPPKTKSEVWLPIFWQGITDRSSGILNVDSLVAKMYTSANADSGSNEGVYYA